MSPLPGPPPDTVLEPPLHPPAPPSLLETHALAISTWAGAVSSSDCSLTSLALGTALDHSTLVAVTRELLGSLYEQGQYVSPYLSNAHPSSTSLFSVSCTKPVAGKRVGCELTDPAVGYVRLTCSCHGKPLGPTGSIQAAPNHIGTGCGTKISLLLKGLITINARHNHEPLSAAVLLRSSQAQTFVLEAITPAFEDELVNFCLLTRGADRSISAATAKSLIRQKCREKGIPFVPNIWSSRIYIRAMAGMEGARENRNDATAFVAQLQQTHPKDSEFFYGTDAAGARTLRAAAWIPACSREYLNRRLLHIKPYAAYDDTFGAQAGYNLAALITTDENNSMLALAYFMIESNFADVHCFVARFIRERLHGETWLRYIFSDEHRSIAMAFRDELPFAHHLLCMLHKMWNISTRRSAARKLPAAESAAAGAAQAEPEAASLPADEAADAEAMSDAEDGENDKPIDLAQGPGGECKPPRFPKAMSIALGAATEAEVELALDAVTAVHSEQTEYINTMIRPNVVKLAAPYRVFLPLNRRSTSQLAESFFSVGKKGAIDPTKPLSSSIGSLEQLAARLGESGHLEKSAMSERQFKSMNKGPFFLTDVWGKDFVRSLEYIAPGARSNLLTELFESPHVEVDELEYDELANEVGQLRPSSDLVAVVRGETKYDARREGYTARDAAFLRWATLGSAGKRFFSGRTTESTRPHVVGVGAGGELVCTCGGLLETLVPCKHMLAACKAGKLAINLLVHSAPCVRTVGSFDLQDVRRFTTALERKRSNGETSVLACLDLKLPFNAVVETLDVLDSAWRSKAAAWRFPVSSADMTTFGGEDGGLDSSVEPADAAEQLSGKRLRDQFNLDLQQLLMVVRALPVSETSRAAMVAVKEDLVRVADNARTESLASQGKDPNIIATGSGSQRKVKRKKGISDMTNLLKRETSALPKAKGPASKRAKV